MKKLFLLLWCCVVAWPVAFAGEGVSGSRFLLLGAGGRAAGMAEAFVGLADDISAGYWNPAGLTSLRGGELMTMYNHWLEGTGHAYAAVGNTLGKNGAFAAQLNYFTAGDIPLVSGSGVRYGSFGAYDLAAVFSYAHHMNDAFSLGSSVKIIEQRIEQTSGRGFALDMGGLYRPFPRLGIGVTVQNIGPGIRFINDATPLPLTIKAGASYNIARTAASAFTLAGDVGMTPLDDSVTASIGGEAVMYRMLALRAGVKIGRTVVPALGLGFTLRTVSVDWATEMYGDLGSGNRVSITMKFGDGGAAQK